METLRVDVVVDTAQAKTLLGKLRAKLQRPEILADKLAKISEDEIEQSFESEGWNGSPWAMLSPKTLADRKRKGYPPGPILQRSKDGRKSVKVIAVGATVQITYLWYMDTHQKGKTLTVRGKSVQIPKRQFAPTELDVNSGEFGQKITDAVEDYLNPSFGEFIKGEISRTPAVLGRVFSAGGVFGNGNRR